MTTSYAEFLRRRGFVVDVREPWGSVGETSRPQGWKLHLSTIPTEARELLDIVLPLLEQGRVAFKVALDVEFLGRLNEGLLGETQVGKFATIYPRSDAEVRRLANRLVDCTRGFHGPVISTDLRLGDIVYARYGGIVPPVVRDRLGNQRPHIRDSTGRLQPDDYSIPFRMPAGLQHPFGTLPSTTRSWTAIPGGNGRSPKLLGPGFILLEVIKSHPKGAVYRGLDVRDRTSMEICVLKQGREWCLSDHEGRDIRSRLRHQARVHAELHGRVPIPRAGEYFEVDGHGFLPFEFVNGRPLGHEILREFGARTWPALGEPRRRRLLNHLIGAIDAVQRMHDEGYVHRDLNATNVFVEDDGGIRLLDLEISHRIDDRSVPYDSGTPGFVSPQQLANTRPVVSDDVHALGALLLMTLSGLEPRRAQFAAPAHRVEQWMALTKGLDRGLAAIAARCLDARASHRPPLREVRDVLLECIASSNGATTKRERAASSMRRAAARRPESQAHASDVQSGLRGLMRGSVADPSGLWLSQPFESDHRPMGMAGRYEFRRSANRGVAGVLYTFGRLARFGYRSKEATARARLAAAWLVSGTSAPDSGMPGLHFGEAGVAVALAEAVSGGIVPASKGLGEFIKHSLHGALDWPDVTHGAAGQGIAALYCADRLGDQRLAKLATRCATYLVESQRPGGYWSWPSDGPSPKGIWTGFAHGTAGITYFLAEYSRRFDDTAAERAWRRAARWLVRRGRRDGASMTWPNRTGAPDRWAWWCHGSIGMALLFLRLFEQTGERQFADIAGRVIRVHPPAFLSENLSQCHGLSGVGEAYLEAARVLDDRKWRQRADSLRDDIWNLRRERGGAASWLVEGPDIPTADLMVGNSGIVHFLLRAARPEEPIGPPLLLDPIRP